MSSGTEYALRLREVEEENARLRADVADAARWRESQRRVEGQLCERIAAAEAESSRLSREVARLSSNEETLLRLAAENGERIASLVSDRARLSREVEGLAKTWESGWGAGQTTLAAIHREHAEALRALLTPSSAPRDPHVCSEECPGEPHDAIGAGAKR